MWLPRSLLLLLVMVVVPGLSVGEHEATRLMYDTMAQLVGDTKYPDTWYNVLTSVHIVHSVQPQVGGAAGVLQQDLPRPPRHHGPRLAGRPSSSAAVMVTC